MSKFAIFSLSLNGIPAINVNAIAGSVSHPVKPIHHIMKSKNKTKEQLPQVQIRGNLKDVRKLIKQVNKKRSVVIFRDAENDLLFVEYDKKIIELSAKDISALENKHRLIYFDFFPSAAENQVKGEKKDKKKDKKKEKKQKSDKGKSKEKAKGKKKADKLKTEPAAESAGEPDSSTQGAVIPPAEQEGLKE
jgi:Mg-chelatase subunit ChlI